MIWTCFEQLFLLISNCQNFVDFNVFFSQLLRNSLTIFIGFPEVIIVKSLLKDPTIANKILD